MSAWPPAGHDRQRELFDDADPGPIEPPEAECRHAAGRVEVYTDDDGSVVELEVKCARCGAWLNGAVDVADLEERGGA